MSILSRLPSIEALQRSLKGPTEFFNFSKLSRPSNLNEATSRISYNVSYFSGNYTLIVAALGVYALVTSPILLLVIAFLFGGMAIIRRIGPEPIQIGQYTLTQKTLYIALWVIGIPLLFVQNPFSLVFWLIGVSAALIFTHAAVMEIGAEAEFQQIPDQQV